MESTIQLTTLKRCPIPSLLGKNFFIPDYQRGYRWEPKQVLQLMEDVYSFFNTKDTASFYCLQPIVVQECSKETKKSFSLESDLDDNRWYEVIDGQQRLTTIRILLAFYFASNQLDDRAPYKIAYATRPGLGLIFDKIEIDFKGRCFTIGEMDGVERNVDRCYIEKCIETIFKCFDHKEKMSPGEQFHLQMSNFNTFFENLLSDGDGKKSVQVLWYETRENRDAREIFERINDLKIPLSNSELIRGLFLSDTSQYPFEEHVSDLDERAISSLAQLDRLSKQRYINAKWDEMEHRLRDKRFWAFITNRKENAVRNRIEVLFDLISGKFDNKGDGNLALRKDDPQYTYLYFDRLIKDGDAEGRVCDLWKLWKRVQACYARLCNWYENNDYYHRIGYLVYLQEDGDQVLASLIAEAELKGRREFDKVIIDRIKQTLPTPSEVKSLDYQKKSMYEKIRRLLILHNVETCRTAGPVGRFPFELFKQKQREKGWTIEHIHAQNSECLDQNDKSTWLDWATVNAQVLRENKKHEKRDVSLLSDLETAVDSLQTGDVKFTHDKIVSLFDRVCEVYRNGEIPALHQLSNLALLDGGINSGIGNSVFEVKRQYISKCDADGDYVPYCTKKVFLKYYYEQSVNDKHLLNRDICCWDADDRRCYLEDIKAKLSQYIPSSAFASQEV